MTESEVAFYLGQLFGAYMIGFASGYLISVIKKLIGYI